jgi:hypothetical protein
MVEDEKKYVPERNRKSLYCTQGGGESSSGFCIATVRSYDQLDYLSMSDRERLLASRKRCAYNSLCVVLLEVHV